MKKFLLAVIFLSFAFSGCRDPINPFDPENPDYVQPDDDGTDIIHSSTMTIEIDGTAMGSGSDYSFGSAEADGGGGHRQGRLILSSGTTETAVYPFPQLNFPGPMLPIFPSLSYPEAWYLPTNIRPVPSSSILFQRDRKPLSSPSDPAMLSCRSIH